MDKLQAYEGTASASGTISTPLAQVDPFLGFDSPFSQAISRGGSKTQSFQQALHH